MEDFLLYFSLGWEHIISVDAADHQLFILSLLGVSTWKKWKNLLILISCFTVGHCLTLILAGSGQVRISTYWVELLIPFTIFLTGAYQWKSIYNPGIESRNNNLFLMAGLFGLIHGLGFAKTLQSILGQHQSIILPLFGFNLGLEIGQLFVLAFVLGLQAVLFLIPSFKLQYWAKAAVALSLFGSGWMMAERF